MDKRICSIDGCEKPARTRGWCGTHYLRWWRQGSDPDQAQPQMGRTRRIGVETCSVEGCKGIVKARGWCNPHWKRWKRTGDPLTRKRGEVVDGKRVCPGCGIDKPLNDYTPGCTSGCLRCMADRSRLWREANPDRIRHKASPDYHRAYGSAWRAEHPEKVRAYASIYRARKRGATIEHFLPIEVFDRDGWICGLCDEPIDRSLAWPDPRSVSLDHILPLSLNGEHSLANTQASHLVCNLRKHTTVA